MTPEQRLWQHVHTRLSGFITRIENTTGSGIPDVVQIRYGGITTWIELKVLDARGRPILRKEQYAWMMRAAFKGARCVVVAAYPANVRCLFLWSFPRKAFPMGSTEKYVLLEGLHDMAIRTEPLDGAIDELFRLQQVKRTI